VQRLLEKKRSAWPKSWECPTLNCGNRSPPHRLARRKILYVTFRKAILPVEEANMLAIPRKQRAMVRKGIKNGLKLVTVDRNVTAFSSALCRQRASPWHAGHAQALFRGVAAEFGDDCEVLTVTGPDGRLLSSVLSFYFRDEVLPYYAGDDESARDLAANDFKYWELMRRACERGLKVFDYGRSKAGHRPLRLQEKLGLRAQPLHYEYCLYKRDSIPQNNPNNPKYKLMIEAWRRMPIGLANWLGPVHCAQPGLGRHGQHALSGPSAALPAQQGRQGALVPPAQALGAATSGLSGHLCGRP
jgi:FemAB-related protein (PEP-CTERM system-associated)